MREREREGNSQLQYEECLCTVKAKPDKNHLRYAHRNCLPMETNDVSCICIVVVVCGLFLLIVSVHS